MDNQDEWGPWITHDGKGCPCVGQFFQGEFNKASNGDIASSVIVSIDGMSVEGVAKGGWSWFNDGVSTPKIIRYRIRKPLGLIILEAIARDTTTPIVKVDA